MGRKPKVSSKTVRDELLKLQDNRGRITPQAVVDEASNPKHPLHNLFEWDDTEAARKYRLDQARELIRSVDVVIRNTKHEIEVVAYVRDPKAKARDQGYVATMSVRNSPASTKAILLCELQRIEDLALRASSLSDAFGLKSDFTKLLNDVRSMMARLK